MKAMMQGLACAAFALALAIGPPASAAQRPDAWVTAKVKIALLTSEGISTTGIDVDTVAGRVTLHGRVGSDTARANAALVAERVEGVRAVRNLLTVEPAADRHAAVLPDAELEQNVKAALSGAPALADSSIRVESVHDGKVRLGGKARTLGDHYAAIDIASRVEGVRGVASDIESPDELADDELWHDGEPGAMTRARETATDLWITAATKMRLLTHSETPAFDINVDTRDGVVTLFGMVDSRAAKELAESEARKVSGVRNVRNDLQIVSDARQASVERSDDAVEAAIEERLSQRSSLAESKIDVQVSNGVARLSGHVDSWSEHLTALTLARSTPGVKNVIDALEVTTTPAVSAR